MSYPWSIAHACAKCTLLYFAALAVYVPSLFQNGLAYAQNLSSDDSLSLLKGQLERRAREQAEREERDRISANLVDNIKNNIFVIRLSLSEIAYMRDHPDCVLAEQLQIDLTTRVDRVNKQLSFVQEQCRTVSVNNLEGQSICSKQLELLEKEIEETQSTPARVITACPPKGP